MKKIIYVLVSSFLISGSFAQNLPKCKITDLESAKTCMKRVSLAMPDYEEPNDYLVSTKKSALTKVLEAVDANDGKAKKLIQNADYVGLMFEHGDEHHIYYFAMKKGSAQSPVEIYDLNTVDLYSILVEPLEVNDLFLGTNAKNICIYGDLKAALEEYDASQSH